MLCRVSRRTRAGDSRLHVKRWLWSPPEEPRVYHPTNRRQQLIYPSRNQSSKKCTAVTTATPFTKRHRRRLRLPVAPSLPSSSSAAETMLSISTRRKERCTNDTCTDEINRGARSPRRTPTQLSTNTAINTAQIAQAIVLNQRRFHAPFGQLPISEPKPASTLAEGWLQHGAVWRQGRSPSRRCDTPCTT